MSQILMKRGPKASMPLLAPGEPCFTTDTHEFWIGSESGNIQFSTENGVSVKEYPMSGIFVSDENTINVKATLPIYTDGDSLSLYIGGLFVTKDVNYTIANGIITKVNDGTGAVWPAGYTYDVVVFKNVVAFPEDPWIDGGTF
jgi:hypothetical protein